MKNTKRPPGYTKEGNNPSRYSRAQPVSECDEPEERGLRAFANLGSKGSALGRRRLFFH